MGNINDKDKYPRDTNITGGESLIGSDANGDTINIELPDLVTYVAATVATGPEGPAGPAGATGATGPAGPAGADGDPGSQFYSGTGAPSAGLGVDGDVYLNDSNGDLYKKVAGTWGIIDNLTGPAGPAGAGSGDMLAATYDPTAVAGDAFSMDNMVEGATTKIMTDAERTKLAGIATGATANSADATLLNRANHSGTQLSSTISDFASAVSSNAAVAANTAKNSYPSADATKLAGIEAGATADMSNAEIKTAYEANSNTNAFTDAEKSKLAGIESGATADQTGSEIKTLYEAQANTNAYTDAEKSKLAGIEAGAAADQSAAEVPVTDAGGYWATGNVEAVLQEVGSKLDLVGTLWQITHSGTSLVFKYDGTTVFTLTSAGALTVPGNVTAG